MEKNAKYQLEDSGFFVKNANFYLTSDIQSQIYKEKTINAFPV
jgi:hypothetical protein